MLLKIAIGLGNSGAEYSNTRHNAGEIILKRFARECGAEFSYNKYCRAWTAKAEVRSKPLILAFADGFMNLSGEGASKILSHFKLQTSEAAVIYDDISLEVGRMKLSLGGSSGGHNGVSDIMNKCGNDFARIRIGIGAKADPRMDLADHVLGRIEPQYLELIDKIKIRECIETIVSNGFEAAQNAFNRRADSNAL